MKTNPPRVTMPPGDPTTPSLSGSFTFASAGLFRSAGVSPSGIVHFVSPVLRSIAVSVPYGGLAIGIHIGRRRTLAFWIQIGVVLLVTAAGAMLSLSAGCRRHFVPVKQVVIDDPICPQALAASEDLACLRIDDSLAR